MKRVSSTGHLCKNQRGSDPPDSFLSQKKPTLAACCFIVNLLSACRREELSLNSAAPQERVVRTARQSPWMLRPGFYLRLLNTLEQAWSVFAATKPNTKKRPNAAELLLVMIKPIHCFPGSESKKDVRHLKTIWMSSGGNIWIPYWFYVTFRDQGFPNHSTDRPQWYNDRRGSLGVLVCIMSSLARFLKLQFRSGSGRHRDGFQTFGLRDTAWISNRAPVCHLLTIRVDWSKCKF